MKPIDQIRRENLEVLVRERGTLEALAAAADTSAVYLSQLRNQLPDARGGRPRSMGTAIARRLEVATGRPIGWMDTPHDAHEGLTAGNPLPTNADPSPTNATLGPALRRRVPLISWARAGSWEGVVDMFLPGDAEAWVETTAGVGPHAFALRIRGDSMTNPDDRRSLPDGAIVVFDPQAVGPLDTLHNKIVVAKRTDEQQATVKLLWFDGGVPYLKPLNPRYPLMPCPADTRVVAVARQLIVDL